MLALLASGLVLPAAPARAQTVGGLIMSGDAALDSDSLAHGGTGAWRWLSYPGARFSVNCAVPATDNVTPPMRPDMALDLGGYLGTGAMRLTDVLNVRVLSAGGTDLAAGLSTARSTTWYPYKLSFQASFPGGVAISGYDFFVDANSTLVRVMEVGNAKGKELCLGGAIGGSGGARWDAAQQVLLVTDAKFAYALRFAALKGERLTASGLPQVAKVVRDAWSLRVPVGGAKAVFAVSFGFAAASEGPDTAVSRAVGALAQPVADSIARTKAIMDGYLRKVPKPTRWGIEGIPACGVTPEQHRRTYYAAWSFLLQDCMDAFPENAAYPYPQVGVGKPSLWTGGEDTSPGTCSWESLLGYQWLCHVRPDFAWKAYEGLMSRVDAQGKLGGESLPSRKAQTAWILYKRTGDRKRLAQVYPIVKRYLLWREGNPRWIFASHDYADEKDLEFVVSWAVDVDYARRIAAELGLMADAARWQDKLKGVAGNLRAWFFKTPGEIHQFYFVDRKTHTYQDRTDDKETRPNYLVTALAVKSLPPDLAARVQSFFLGVHDPKLSGDGFPYTKYPNVNLISYGLIDRGMPEAKTFVQAMLRDAIRMGEFSEVMVTGPKAYGVRPSLFSALATIEFTWMLNGVRYDSGSPATFDFPAPRP